MFKGVLYFLFKKQKNMKTITLTPQEFYIFKQLANFYYNVIVKSGVVKIIADPNQLKQIGY